MDFKHTLEIVAKDIQDTEKLVSNFKNYSRIPGIELNLALSKLQNVYEVLLMIRNNQEQFIHVEKSPSSEGDPVKENDISPEPVKEETIEEIDIMPEKIEKKEIKEESKQPSHKAFETHGKIIAEKFSADQPVHEKLRGNSHKPGISEIHQLSPIRNIAGSMGINDKFYYIRELFHGDAELFRQTLEALDSSKDYTSALSFITSKFNWNMESKPAENLMNLVKRKFIKTGNE